MAQVEVITGISRRRKYTEEQKLAVLAEAFAPGVFVREVIRRHDIPASSVYKWRQQYGWSLPHKRTASPMTAVTDSGFARVVAATNREASGAGMIELEVGSSRIRMPGSIAPELAAAIVVALVQK